MAFISPFSVTIQLALILPKIYAQVQIITFVIFHLKFRFNNFIYFCNIHT